LTEMGSNVQEQTLRLVEIVAPVLMAFAPMR